MNERTCDGCDEPFPVTDKGEKLIAVKISTPKEKLELCDSCFAGALRAAVALYLTGKRGIS